MKDTSKSIIDLPEATISILEEGIMKVHIKVEDEFTIDDSKAIVEARTKLANGRKMAMLYTTSTKFVIPSKEVREYVATEERSEFVTADAFVISSLAQRLAVRFFIRFNKPVRPTRFFESEEAALEWLQVMTHEFA